MIPLLRNEYTMKKKNLREITDLIDDPNFNPSTNNARGDWSLRDVTSGAVWLDVATNAPRCVDHGAMNCVSPSRTLWRCLACGRACYMPSP